MSTCTDCNCGKAEFESIEIPMADGGKVSLSSDKNGNPTIAFTEAAPTRKDMPVFSGVLQYFPDAIMAVALHSKRGNDKHNPGQPLHWAKGKSMDHADCIARHLIDIGPNWDHKDPETGSLHAMALAWRALALLQTVLERNKE